MYLQLNLYINWLRRNQSFEIRETKKKHIFFVKFSHFLRSLHPEYIIFYFFFYKDIYIFHISSLQNEKALTAILFLRQLVFSFPKKEI